MKSYFCEAKKMYLKGKVLKENSQILFSIHFSLIQFILG